MVLNKKFLVILICSWIPIQVALAKEVNSSTGYLPVSLIQLVAVPEQFVGKKIRVTGWFEMNSLFVTKEHFRMRDLASAVSLFEPVATGDMTIACESRYVRVSGMLVEEPSGYLIQDISRVYDVFGQAYCWGKAPR
jgi:hypothetical protein